MPELLIVIAIIALLVSLLVPVLADVRKSAMGVECLSHLRNIGQAVTMYCSDHHGEFPLSSHTAGSLVDSAAWLNSLEKYGVTDQDRFCPLDLNADQKLTSYATNEHFEPLAAGIDYNPFTGQPIPGGRTIVYDNSSMIPRPYATIYAYEPDSPGTVDHLSTHEFATSDDVADAIAVRRHLDAANYLFVDGHVRSWLWSDFSARFSPQTSPFDPRTAH